MDNIAFEIISSYEQISVESSPDIEEVIIFSYGERRFAFICPQKDDPASSGCMLTLNDTLFNQPHILLREIDFEGCSTLPPGKYRNICLYESGSIVYSLLSYEDKIIDAIERLLTLLNLSPMQKEKEFQKEFLVYWNTVAKGGKRDIYLEDDQSFSVLSVYQSKDLVRYVAPKIHLNDLDSISDGKKIWQQHIDISALYMPIIDNRGILPPTKDFCWGKKQILEIICSDTTNHISAEAFQHLGSMQIKYDTLDIVFGMTVTQVPYTFLVRINFNGGNEFSLLERINNNIRSIEMLQCKRMDYSYLNRIIGNSTNNIDKKILLIGAGSLGSYIASELVKNGFNNITLYDGDDLVSENFMRWYYSGIFKNSKKASQIKFFLELMHPEIHVDAHNEYIDSKKIVENLISADYIIFTIGSSDTQLCLNRVLQENGCKAKVLYAWLEAGGHHSHILKINYNFPGCYECLFTNDTGDIVNNQANLAEDKVVEFNTIHNGCGATRAAYGTSVLLRTTSVLLDVLNKEEKEKGLGNYLVNITPESVMYDNGSFIKEVCHCCGN